MSDATLKMLIKDNQNTDYGQKYGFSHIGSVAEYKEQVPFTTYDDYAEYVSRVVEGEVLLEKNTSLSSLISPDYTDTGSDETGSCNRQSD